MIVQKSIVLLPVMTGEDDGTSTCQFPFFDKISTLDAFFRIRSAELFSKLIFTYAPRIDN